MIELPTIEQRIFWAVYSVKNWRSESKLINQLLHNLPCMC